MKRADHNDDDDVEIVPVPMNAATRRRLVAFASQLGVKEIHAAGMLFADLLSDDEFWNAAGGSQPDRLN